MKQQKQELQPSGSRIALRTAAFLLALAAAVFFITFGVVRIGHKDPGYHTIEAAPDADALMYAKGVYLQSYFEGKSDAIKAGINGVKPVYSAALLRAYKLLDAETEYEGMNNLASLNAHPGEELALSEELFDVLMDAREKTAEGRGFDMFAGALYRAWRDLRYLSAPEPFDPLRDPEQAERLRRLTEATQQSGNVELQVVDAPGRTVRLVLSEEYRALLEELELEGPVLDLNLMHDAYLLRIVAGDLIRAGFTRAFLSTDSGLTLALPDNPEGQLLLYGYAEGQGVPAASRPAGPGTAASRFRAFPMTPGELDFYEIDGHLRHPYLPASGVYHDVLACSLVVADDPVEACYANIRLQEQATEEALRKEAAESGGAVAFCLQNDALQRVFVVGEGFRAEEDYGWRLEPLA